MSMLNWRRDPGYEQRKIQHELRMKQLKNEIEQIKSDSEQIEKDCEQIEKETEQLRRENARQKALSALIKQHCFPPESNSTQAQSTAPDSKPSLP